MRNINRYTEDYNHAVFEKYQVEFRRKRVLEILKEYHPKRILEIGCGAEPLFSYVDWTYEAYTVIEPSVVFIEHAKKLAKDKPVHFINGCFPVTENLKEQGFDFIVCSSLLHEVEDPEAFLCQMASICNEATVVHINVPNANSMHRLMALEMGMIHDVHEMSERNKTLQQSHVFDQELLNNLVRHAGFRITDQGSYFVKPFTHQQMHQMLESGILTKDMLEGLYRLTKYMPQLGSEIYVNCRI